MVALHFTQRSRCARVHDVSPSAWGSRLPTRFESEGFGVEALGFAGAMDDFDLVSEPSTAQVLLADSLLTWLTFKTN